MSNDGTLVSTVGLAQADRATAVAMTARFRQMDKNALKWTRLSCGKFRNNEVRLQLHALAYNLANFMRTLALPKEVEHWSLTTLREKLVKIGAKNRPSWPVRYVPTGRGCGVEGTVPENSEPDR